jgi:iron complex transport system substrate-binding protein
MDQDVVPMYGKREDRVIYLDLTDQFAGTLGFASALSLDYLLDEAAPQLADAVDGRPRTKVEQPQ